MLCKRHHDMKTYCGWVLARDGDGSWSFSPPDDYRDPEPADPAVGEQVLDDPWTGRRAEAHAAPQRASGPIGDVPGPRRRGASAEQLALAGAAGPSP
jgi:hypothetical protein